MQRLIEENYFLFKDQGKKDIAIVKHYVRKTGMDQKSWEQFARKYKTWDANGNLGSMFLTILAMHRHFIAEEGAMVDDRINDDHMIPIRMYHRSIRDFYDEDIREKDKEIDRLKNETDMMPIEDHNYHLKIQAQGFDAQIDDLKYENEKLKQSVKFEQEKRMSADSKHAHREAYLNKELDKLTALPPSG
jgi:hypothetical protein